MINFLVIPVLNPTKIWGGSPSISLPSIIYHASVLPNGDWNKVFAFSFDGCTCIVSLSAASKSFINTAEAFPNRFKWYSASVNLWLLLMKSISFSFLLPAILKLQYPSLLFIVLFGFKAFTVEDIHSSG